MKRLAAIAMFALSCGGAAAPPPAPMVVAPETASTSENGHSTGANGPRDAKGMIGDYGAISPADPGTIMLVNSAAMRADPLGGRVMQLITGVFVGWGEFMPLDLIDPLKDLDWVLLTGSLVMGHTQPNVYLARYRVDETRADAIFQELTKRLKNVLRTELGVRDVASLAASIDHADRAYVRSKGLLAIGPLDAEDHFAEVLTHAKGPATFRVGELARLVLTHPRRVPMPLPPGVTGVRVWLDDREGQALVLAAEGDYPDADAARSAIDELRTILQQSVPPLARGLLRPLIDDANIWADGQTLRYEAVLPAGLVDLAANMVCLHATGQADCGQK